jgi:hypothetical protein
MIYRPILEYEGLYEISDSGVCRSLRRKTPRELKPIPVWTGYVRVGLYDENGENMKLRYLHRLVWEAHRDKIPKGFQINHKNGIKNDNRLCNLEVLTPSENGKHAYRIGLAKTQKGIDCHFCKLTEQEVIEIMELHRSGIKQLDIAHKFNVSRSNISHIVNRKSWPDLKR